MEKAKDGHSKIDYVLAFLSAFILSITLQH